MLGPANMRSIPERCVPNPEPVTYFVRSPTDTYTQYAVSHSKRKKLDKVEADVGPLVVESGTQHWQFWVSKLAQAGIVFPTVPRIDDYFVDKYGAGWNIIAANFAAMRERYDVECTNQEGTYLWFATTKLLGGTVGTPYSQTVAVTNTNGMPAFSLYAGSLPTSLSLNASTGTIVGTPSTTVGSPFQFSIGVIDNSGATIVMPYAVAIAA